MIFDESDIQFGELNSIRFEELCFDLLSCLGFHSLIWRQGGADQGRDIEAHFSVTNPLVKTYDERWFFECKNYTGGVPVDEIGSKIAWADAEKPKHFVIITSSYLSNSARAWLEKVSKDKPYKTHSIEGKQLKTLLLAFPELIIKYFADQYVKLLAEVKRNWVTLDVLPDGKTVYLLYRNLDPTKLSRGYLAFLYCLWLSHKGELELHYDDDHKPTFEYVVNHLINTADSQLPILDEYDDIKFTLVGRADPAFRYTDRESSITVGETSGPQWEVLTAQLVFKTKRVSKRGLYCFKVFGEAEGLEVLVEQDAELPAKVRYIKSNARIEQKRLDELIGW